jgi:hypothetical protein
MKFVFSHLYENRFVSDLEPILFNTLYIVFALAFFLNVLSGSQPNSHAQSNRMIYIITHIHNNSKDLGCHHIIYHTVVATNRNVFDIFARNFTEMCA